MGENCQRANIVEKKMLRSGGEGEREKGEREYCRSQPGRYSAEQVRERGKVRECEGDSEVK